jgi:hypothetical protein
MNHRVGAHASAPVATAFFFRFFRFFLLPPLPAAVGGVFFIATLEPTPQCARNAE